MNRRIASIPLFLISVLNVMMGMSTVAQEPRHLIGNGRLTLGFDDGGRLSLCNWPSPGYYPQLSSPLSDPALPNGIQWGLEMGGSITWIGDDAWDFVGTDRTVNGDIITLRHKHQSLDVSAVQTYRVDYDADVLHAAITLHGIETSRLIWYADFDPRTQLNRRLASQANGTSHSSDFAAVVNDNANQIVHFRVRSAGSELVKKVAHWIAEKRRFETWADLGGGTWIAYSSPQQIVQKSVGSIGEGIAPLLDDHSNESIGNTHSLMIMEPEMLDDGAFASVVVAFGEDSETAETLVNQHFQHHADTSDVSRETPAFRKIRSGGTMYVRDLLSRLDTMIDSDSGALVTDWERESFEYSVTIPDAANGVFALALAGRSSQAESLLNFLLLRAYRSTDGRYPLGAVPGHVFANGEPASPHFKIDLLPAASVIWAAENYVRTMDQNRRRDFCRERWDTVELMADFLDQWIQPSLSIDVSVVSESKDIQRDLASAYIGLKYAIKFAERVDGHIPKIWKRTLQRCDLQLNRVNISVSAPWDVQIGLPANILMATSDLTDPDALDSTMKALTPYNAMYLLASLGYQNYSARDRSQWSPFRLRGNAENMLKDPSMVEPAQYTPSYIAMFLSSLYLSYQ